jgi:cyanophycinase-like exopeptidase
MSTPDSHPAATGRVVLMGSGETTSTMVELHKSLVRRAGRVTVLDTPYGFQENADELSARAVAYFTESVGVDADVVSLRTADLPPAQVGAALHAVSEAEYVFAGPGSPTYALAQWRAVGLDEVLTTVVRRGGVVCLASAASISAGALSLPVYELYKVGQAPYWEQGLDLLGHLGLRTIVVPHFNNTEGGTHDTSCCYVGRRRLEILRAQAPDLPVLGIDEHTAVVIDPATGQAQVHGTGSVHVLVGDDHRTVANGSTLDLAAALSAGGVVGAPTEQREHAPVTGLQQAVASQDAAAVVHALVELVQADARQATSLAALAPALERGWSTPSVDLLLEARRLAREDKQWQLSDLLRDGLAALGVVVEDTPDGQRIRG